MIARQGIWAEVEPGMYVRDKAGTVWRIDGARAGQIVLKDRSEQERLLTPPARNAAVTIMEPSHEEAVATVAEKMAAATMAIEEDGTVRTPLWPAKLDLARSHLFLMHGMFANDIKSLAEATKAHDVSHADPDRGYVHHIHGGI